MLSPKDFIQSVGSESILFAHKADLLLKQDEVDQALELCEEGVKRFPFYTEGYVQLARCYQMKEEYKEAIDAYQNALFYQPGHSKALKGLAYLYYKLRQKELGESALLKAFLYDPFDDELYDFLNSEGLLAKVYMPPVFEEEEEEENEPGKVMLDLEEILEDTRLTPEDERNQILEEIDEHVQVSEEELLEEKPLQELDAVKTDEDISAKDDSNLESDSGISASEIESDFFPEDISEITPELADIEKKEDASEEETNEVPPEPESEKTHEGEDFSEWMNDLFKQDEQTDKEADEIEPQKENLIPEKDDVDSSPAELDTILIFADRRNSELDFKEEQEAEEEKEKEKKVADFNTLEDDIERISSQEADKIEQNMVLPESETSESEADLDEVIKRLQETSEKRKDDSDIKQLEFDRLQAKAVEEDSVNIEDILSNPSLLTPTFGEILIAQHKFEDALKVFNALAEKEPENPRFRKKIDFLNKLVSAGK